MTTTHLILRYVHISMGMLALMSGAASMVLRKGSSWHRRAGTVFFLSMVIMAFAGTYISVFVRPAASNIGGGLLTIYLTATAWATMWRSPGVIGRLEIAMALLGLGIAITCTSFAMQAASSPTGRFDDSPPLFFAIFGAAAFIGSALDARMIARGGFTGTARLTRHLVRMCLAMFMATASFFLGQAKLFPAEVRATGVLNIPVLLVVMALVYWMIRVRLIPWVRRVRGGQAVSAHG